MTRERISAFAYLTLLAAVNFYLCRNLFIAEFTGHTNSIQGLWISMARLAGEHWFRPAWWPYQDAGVPFEHTYMPLVPAATALVAKLTGFSTPRAFFSVTGLVLVFGPITLFLAIWRMSRMPGCAFWAALLYSLTSPARALLPETDINPIRYWSSLRFYGAVVWDDLPHQTAVCMLPLALLFLCRSFEKPRPLHYLLAIVCIVLTVLPSVFGATALVLGAACLLAAQPKERFIANLRLLAVLGGVSYLIVSPFLPPSVIAAIRSNQQRFVEDRWSAGSFVALVIVLAGAWLIHQVPAQPWLRFFALFAFVAASIPLVDAYLHLHFLPQPNRYTAEMELGIALFTVPVIARLWSIVPKRIAISAAAFLVLAAAEHLPGILRFADESTRPIDLTRGIEARIAGWVDDHMPGQRVMVPGSIAQWFNVFSATPQLSGASYSTTPNWTQHEAMKSVLTSYTTDETAIAVLWLKAFGVQAATAVGRNSPEFWKGVSSTKFDGQLPILWREGDTTIYRVPQRSASLAHVVPAVALARDPSVDELRKYVQALDDVSLPLANFQWGGVRQASIATTVRRGEVVSVQTGYHPGWHTTSNAQACATRRDGLGLLVVEPTCDGPCRIDLTYDGGWEYKLARALSLLTLFGIVGYLWRVKRWSEA